MISKEEALKHTGWLASQQHCPIEGNEATLSCLKGKTLDELKKVSVE